MEPALAAALTVGGLLVWSIDPGPPPSIGADMLGCALAALILGQGLVRDLIQMATRRRARARGECPAQPVVRGQEVNVCLESTLGLGLLGLAAVHAAFPTPPQIVVPRGLLVAATGLVVCGGWLVRDWVLTVRHVENHYDLPVVGRVRATPSRDEGAGDVRPGS
jgi:hypothetical protein